MFKEFIFSLFNKAFTKNKDSIQSSITVDITADSVYI